MPEISIIICTCNRAKSLTETLRRFNRVLIPADLSAELVVVDNASEDDTAQVVRAARVPGLELRYFYEPKRGKCNAYNTGIKVARGEVLLFTDDDVQPAPEWVERLAKGLLNRECDAVVGHVALAEDLERPWMTAMHKVWLAAPGAVSDGQLELIGANMGFHRSVLERVPAFDPELGPGALGFGDDSLFSNQLCEAGYRLREVREAGVVHHLDRSRLLRSYWISDARKRGAVLAYVLHHWHHADVKNPLLRAFWLTCKLRLRRLLEPPVSMDEEGCAAWEISYLTHAESLRKFARERRRPRNYTRHGLVRLDAGRRDEAELRPMAWR